MEDLGVGTLILQRPERHILNALRSWLQSGKLESDIYI